MTDDIEAQQLQGKHFALNEQSDGESDDGN